MIVSLTGFYSLFSDKEEIPVDKIIETSLGHELQIANFRCIYFKQTGLRISEECPGLDTESLREGFERNNVFSFECEG